MNCNEHQTPGCFYFNGYQFCGKIGAGIFKWLLESGFKLQVFIAFININIAIVKETDLICRDTQIVEKFWIQ